MYDYFKSCCDFEPSEVDDLNSMIDENINVTLATIRKHCSGFTDWTMGLGYEKDSRKGLTIANDWAVSYHRSKYKGQRCYYVRWSAIEYIWLQGDPAYHLDRLRGRETLAAV
jgi:hypothetical protein